MGPETMATKKNPTVGEKYKNTGAIRALSVSLSSGAFPAHRQYSKNIFKK